MSRLRIDEGWFAWIYLYIQPNNADIPLLRQPFKVDTGANISSISKTDLAKLGFDRAWILQNGELDENVDIANGSTVNDCYRITLPQVRFGTYFCENALFITSLTDEMRNLFGLNFIRYFNWGYDYDAREVEYLRNRSGDDGGRYRFSIHEVDRLKSRKEQENEQN
ncbi:MAG: retroviral-like aspartic protease family protein [Turicibacter sp.]|nr:retroviral-like aspartic protease family protein [Turicibacter sp.]